MRFVYGRSKGIFERGLHWLLRNFNLFHINVDYNKPTADAAFEWLVNGVKAIDPMLLPETPQWYIHAFAKDDLPWALRAWPWPLVNPLAPLGKDAYEWLFTSGGLVGLLNLLPVVGPFFRVIMDETVRIEQT